MNHNNKADFRSAKVLLVDDDKQLVLALSTRLSEIGCRCVGCSNASEAMVQFAAGGFDLVITDMAMPGIDGLSIVAMIRSQSEIPILVMTGRSAQYGPLIAGYRNVKLIRKPLEPLALIASVRSCMPGKLASEVELKCG